MAALHYLIWLTTRRSLRPEQAAELIRRFGSAEAVYFAGEEEYGEVPIAPLTRADLSDKSMDGVERILADSSSINEAARACKDASSALFVGRGMGAAIACEGALKLQEISYLHAEAYPAGEMKHGPIALIDEGFPVIAVATKSPVYDKLVSNLQEAKARGAMVVAIATEGDEDIRHHADHVIYIPKVRDAFSAITASVPLQLFARAIAVERGCDVDQPRNLAKSVTVE